MVIYPQLKSRCYLRHCAFLFLPFLKLTRFRTILARLRASMRRLTVMHPVMESILNAEQLARCTLHPTELHAALQVNNSALKCPLQFHHTRVTGLETRQVGPDPCSYVIDAHFRQIFQVLSEPLCPLNIRNKLAGIKLIPFWEQRV